MRQWNEINDNRYLTSDSSTFRLLKMFSLEYLTLHESVHRFRIIIKI